MKRKMMLVLAAMVLIAAFTATTAMARDIDNYSTYMYNNNESDTTGVFSTAWSLKVTDYIDAAIRCDDYYYHDYNFKASLYNTSTRVTDYDWLNDSDRYRKTPAFVPGYGAAGNSYRMWSRRDDRETSYRSLAVGSFSSDFE